MSEAQAINYRGRKAARAGSEQRRKAILEASLRIVVKEGVRGVRHRAVAKEANVPLSATTYYFKDISDLIADTFALFVEKVMSDLVVPIYKHVGDFLEHNRDQVKTDPVFANQVIDSLTQMIVAFIKVEVTEQRDQMLAEQAFKHECLRDEGLRAIAQTYFDHLLSEMVELCRQIEVDDPEIAGELLMATMFRIEHEGLLVPPDQFDEVKATKMIRQLLQSFSPVPYQQA
ncbi:MAG: TetR family transcriptional regulator [Pseudomonadales bacterium]|nr:TetR family transcriptional regulator [Pseudomonadales bacterium]